MTEIISATLTVAAPPEAVFDVLADPATHQAIDGTGWVREALDTGPLTEIGQTFGMAMFHANHPDGRYEIVNRVTAFDAPRAIAWEPGQQVPDGWVTWGGWIWRYDLIPVGEGTQVVLSYDWSAVPAGPREEIQFPPFPPSHLDNSLANLARLATD